MPIYILPIFICHYHYRTFQTGQFVEQELDAVVH
jgi:hypothetical protein